MCSHERERGVGGVAWGEERYVWMSVMCVRMHVCTSDPLMNVLVLVLLYYAAEGDGCFGRERKTVRITIFMF